MTPSPATNDEYPLDGPRAVQGRGRLVMLSSLRRTSGKRNRFGMASYLQAVPRARMLEGYHRGDAVPADLDKQLPSKWGDGWRVTNLPYYRKRSW